MLGVHLSLLIGPTVAVPVGPLVMEAVEDIEVTHTDQGRSGFQITFKMGRGGGVPMLDFPLLSLQVIKPFYRVILVVMFNISPRVLFDGVITNIQNLPSNEAGGSKLKITGEDVSMMMDREEKQAEFPAMDETVIANLIIASYAQYGLIPNVIPPLALDVPIPIERTPVQQSTDLKLLESMAARHGYVFYVEPGPAPMTNTAYWGPPVRAGAPQKALSFDLGPATNVDSINFQYDALQPSLVSAQVQDRLSNAAMPVQTFSSTRMPPLALEPAMLPGGAGASKKLLDVSGLSAPQAMARAQGTTDRSTDEVVKATGELDALRYQEVLKPRGLAGLRGVGQSYNGLYYVKSVTHRINRDGYKQQFTMTREGTGSTVPGVMP